MARKTIKDLCLRCARHISRVTLLAVLAQVATPQAVMAQVTDIWPTTTNITSTAVRMISYRNQQHSWQSGDGVIHILVNRGNVDTGDSLAMYSSYDSGMTWTQMFTLANTDAFSTSDGVVSNGVGAASSDMSLFLAYGSNQSTGAVLGVYAQYNSAAMFWSVSAPQIVYASANRAGSNPSCAVDTAGNFWCAFTLQDLAAGTYQLTAAFKGVGSLTWQPTTLLFGGVDTSLQRSARPVPYRGGIAMLYQDATTMYWAYRQNEWDMNAPWVTSVLYTGLPPAGENPYGTHYSVAPDSAGNLHMGFVANKRFVYFRYIANMNRWGLARPLTRTESNAAYTQVSIVDDNVVLIVNNLTALQVRQSNDMGKTFSVTHVLRHEPPPAGSSLDYTNPRVESPGRATSPLPVFQQFVDGQIQRLMFFQVPVVM